MSQTTYIRPISVEGSLHVTAPWAARFGVHARGAAVEVRFQRWIDLVRTARTARRMKSLLGKSTVPDAWSRGDLTLIVAVGDRALLRRSAGKGWRPSFRRLAPLN